MNVNFPTQAGTVNAICWLVNSSGEVLAVSVGQSGTVVLWNVDTNITRKFYVSPNPRGNAVLQPQPDVALTHVEPVPGEDMLLVAAQKVIMIVNVKSELLFHTSKECFE